MIQHHTGRIVLRVCFLLLSLNSLVCIAFKPAVVCGADLLFTENFKLIKGKNVALVANHSAMLQNGTHLADALFAHPDVHLRVLFGMEYNIRSNDYSIERDQEKDIDKPTGLIKYSLYGHTHKPVPEMLGDTEVIIFDMQEVGVRFYEHVNILGFVMEAAAEQGITVIVLDRPNPITGLQADGFVTEDAFIYNFGSYAKIPVRHGMTIGELATFYNEERLLKGGVKARLYVIKMKGWKRNMWYNETGLPWKKPSPNLLTDASVLAYSGTCLFESLNISEGRGSDKPFEYIGAPWIDHHHVISLLKAFNFKGVRFEPIVFVPKQPIHSKRPPELAGESCKGIYVHVTRREQFEPYKVAVALVWAIHQLHADQMVWNEKSIVRLSGGTRLLNLIREGKHPSEIYRLWETELEQFLLKRKKYLLYT